MIYNAKYYQDHFKAGLLYDGRNEEGEEEWIGTTDQWNDLAVLEAEEVVRK